LPSPRPTSIPCLKTPPTSFLETSYSVTAATNTQLYTLSLHDALPIFFREKQDLEFMLQLFYTFSGIGKLFFQKLPHLFIRLFLQDRKSTRLNSSHVSSSYAVFCLKQKKSKGPQRKTTWNILSSLFQL